MKSYIYACALAVIGLIMIPLIFGGITIYDDQQNEAAIIDLLTGGFISYMYTSTSLASLYAILIRLKKVNGNWWLNLSLFVMNTLILPFAFIAISLNGTEIDPTLTGGAKIVGEHMFYATSIVAIVFILGFFIKQPKEIQPVGI